MRYKTVAVQGIIGSGKTQLAQELAPALGDDTLLILEPDEKQNANPYLAWYYKDEESRKRWGFTMQVHMLGMRFRQQLDAQWYVLNGRGNAVLDSSYYADTCYARMLFRMGIVTKEEYETYCSLYQSMTAHILLPNAIVRTLVKPETARHRISKRMEKQEGRKPEKTIDVDYLNALNREIDQMTDVLEKRGVKIYTVPWDADRDSVEQRQSTVEALAVWIRSLEPVDGLLDLHRRTT